MRILADIGKCEGYASCVVAAPEFFDLDDEGLVKILVEHPSEEHRIAVEEAVRVCPKRAIWIDEA